MNKTATLIQSNETPSSLIVCWYENGNFVFKSLYSSPGFIITKKDMLEFLDTTGEILEPTEAFPTHMLSILEDIDKLNVENSEENETPLQFIVQQHEHTKTFAVQGVGINIWSIARQIEEIILESGLPIVLAYDSVDGKYVCKSLREHSGTVMCNRHAWDDAINFIDSTYFRSGITDYRIKRTEDHWTALQLHRSDNDPAVLSVIEKEWRPAIDRVEDAIIELRDNVPNFLFKWNEKTEQWTATEMIESTRETDTTDLGEAMLDSIRKPLEKTVLDSKPFDADRGTNVLGEKFADVTIDKLIKMIARVYLNDGPSHLLDKLARTLFSETEYSIYKDYIFAVEGIEYEI